MVKERNEWSKINRDTWIMRVDGSRRKERLRDIVRNELSEVRL